MTCNKNISSHFAYFMEDLKTCWFDEIIIQQAWTGSAFNHELVGLMDVTFNEMGSY